MNNYEDYLTITNDGLDIEANNINANCITSKNNTFSMDSDGNLTVNSITINDASSNPLSFEAIFNRIYPVGSIYISTNNINPGTLFTGTWERIEERFLIGASNNYVAGTTGGSFKHSHTSAAHSHGYGTLYSAMMMAGTYGTRYKSKTGISFTPNERKADTGAGYNYSTKCTEGIQIYGNTGSTTPGNTGETSSLPPYLSVYIWKRVS